MEMLRIGKDNGMNGDLENLIFWESWYLTKLMIEIKDMEDGNFKKDINQYAKEWRIEEWRIKGFQKHY